MHCTVFAVRHLAPTRRPSVPTARASWLLVLPLMEGEQELVMEVSWSVCVCARTLPPTFCLLLCLGGAATIC